MELKLISKIEYDKSLESRIDKRKIFLSPDTKYDIKETYAGNYLRGDNHSNVEILKVKRRKIIRKLGTDILVRQLKMNPWTIDSSFCYFNVIDQGGRVMFYDLRNDKLDLAFFDSDRLNSINFIPSNINGAVILTYPYQSEVGEDWQYYFHNPISNKLTLINDIVKSKEPIRPFDSIIKDTIVVLDLSELYIVNITDRTIVERYELHEKLDRDVIHWNRGFVTDNKILLNLFPNKDNQDGKYYRLEL